MLKPSGSAPSAGAPGIHSRTDSAKTVSFSNEAVTEVGRNEVTPRAASARAMPDRAAGAAHGVVAAPAVHVDVDEAGHHDDAAVGRLPSASMAAMRPSSSTDSRPDDLAVVDDQSAGDASQS